MSLAGTCSDASPSRASGIVLGGGKQVKPGVLESDTPWNIDGVSGHGLHQTVIQRDVGHLVDDCRAGRQGTIFDSQVRLAVRDTVARPVPAPYGAVVQRQRA
jgi:hypothetical protein